MLLKRLIALTLFAALAVMPAYGLRAQWVQTNGLSEENVWAFAVNGSNLFAGTEHTVYLSTDNGASWSEANSGLGNKEVSTFAASGTDSVSPVLFAGTEFGIAISTNDGKSWIDTSTAVNGDVWAIAEIGANTSSPMLFAGTDVGGIYVSTNKGSNWKPSNIGLSDLAVFAIATIGANSSSPILFAGTDSGVFRSTNNGASWIGTSTGLINDIFNPNISSLAFIGTNLFAAAYEDVFLSTDSGKSWASVSNGLPNFVVWTLAVSGTNLFAGTEGGGVYLSTNNGTNWTPFNTGLTNTNINAITVTDSNLFAGTEGSGVWRLPLSDVIGQNAVTEAPVIRQEIKSYPNPFSQSTQISFTSPDAGYADITIVNLLGEQVVHVFSGELDAGEHNFTFSNTAGLPDGTYECLIRMNGQVQTLPVVLIH